MKINPNYVLYQVMHFYIVVGLGDEDYTPDQILSLNGTGAFLWHILEREGGASQEELMEALIREYDIDTETAAVDVNTFLRNLRERSLIIE